MTNAEDGGTDARDCGGDDDDEDEPVGEGMVDGSHFTRLVDMDTYDDGFKWRK